MKKHRLHRKGAWRKATRWPRHFSWHPPSKGSWPTEKVRGTTRKGTKSQRGLFVLGAFRTGLYERCFTHRLKPQIIQIKVTDYTDRNSRLHRLRFLFFLFWFTLYTLHFTLYTAFAAPHISGKHIPGQPKDHVHKIPDVRQLRALGLSPKAIQQAIGAVGTKKVAVVLISFTATGPSTSGSPGFVNYNIIVSSVNKLRDFYREVSYQLLNLEFEFKPSSYSAYTANNSMFYYGSGSLEEGDELIKEAITKANISTGTFDCVMVIHAGYGNESTDNSGDIWSMFYLFSNTNGFTEGLIVPELEEESSPFGVYCHEFGHQLGLPDLYQTIDTDNNGKLDSQVGKWCLMAYGIWAGSPTGSQPTHPSAWCKKRLWISPGSPPFSEIYQIETNFTKSLYKGDAGAGEYFLFENRQKVGFDSSLPGSGLLIWHIDGSIADNESRITSNDINISLTHPGIDLEEADRTPAYLNEGDTGDPFYEGNNTEFTVNTNPSSKRYDGSDSGIAITGISVSGPIMYLRVAPELELVKFYNYPNPTYQTYTTIKIVTNKPFLTLPLKIYNLSGELVFEYSLSQKEYKEKEAERYIYEYIWNLKNNDEQAVASGIYFYVVGGSEEKKVGKLAIIK